MHTTDARAVRVTISLNEGVYENIKDISRKMGIRPSTWISMVCTSRTNNVHLRILDDMNGKE